MNMINFDTCPYSIKNGTYGGMAGSKDGVVYQNENWLIKYPASLKNMKNTDASYSTTPLSEYLGSHVFGLLGFDVHDTLLGTRNGKVVVACRDFLCEGENLLEIRTIKNFFSHEYLDFFTENYSGTGNNHFVDFEELMAHIDKNPILVEIPNIRERFWRQAVVDVFINNSDRNNGNWGIIRDNKGNDRLAPVFDNGASFQTKLTEDKVNRLLLDKTFSAHAACNTQTVYAINGHILSSEKFLSMAEDIPDMAKAISHLVPNIISKMPEIKKMLFDIPESVVIDGTTVSVCSQNKKELFLWQLESRLKNLFVPAYERLKSQAVKETALSLKSYNIKRQKNRQNQSTL